MQKEMRIKTPTEPMREAALDAGREMRIMVGDQIKDVKEAIADGARLEGGIRGGDTKLVWDTENEDETLAAQQTFEKLTKKGFRSYAVGRRGQRVGQPLTEFDPEAEKLIMVPAMAGG